MSKGKSKSRSARSSSGRGKSQGRLAPRSPSRSAGRSARKGTRSGRRRHSSSRSAPWLARWLVIGSGVVLVVAGVLFYLFPEVQPSIVNRALNFGKQGLAMFNERPQEWPPVRGGRSVESIEEAQIALARFGYCPGAITGNDNVSTRQALIAFQRSQGLPETGILDAGTSGVLRIMEPVFVNYQIKPEDLAGLRPPVVNWRGRAELDHLGYHSLIELVAERSRSADSYIARLNVGVDINGLRPGETVRVPAIDPIELPLEIRYLRVRLGARILEAFSDDGRLLLHFPVSIAREVDKRPVGQLQIVNRVENPNYTFNPELFPEASQREGITGRLIIQPGPNNPVGTVWLGLDRAGYGIHGTPEPEAVGRTESSGCFRLANWNAETLLRHVSTGTPVFVED